jgi:hypothetical protein
MELMKLSNKILVGFFGFIFLYLSAAFAELRLMGTPNVVDEKNSIVESVDLTGVAYLVINDLDKNIHVVASEKAQLEVRSLSGELLKQIKYQVSNDTLTVTDLPEEKRSSVKITLFVRKTGFKGMTVNQSEVMMSGLQQKHLYIVENSGRIWISESKIGKIQVNASGESNLDISETRVDTLSAELRMSHVQVSSVRLLEGSMKQSSSIQLGDVDEIQFKKDKSSRLSMYR